MRISLRYGAVRGDLGNKEEKDLVRGWREWTFSRRATCTAGARRSLSRYRLWRTENRCASVRLGQTISFDVCDISSALVQYNATDCWRSNSLRSVAAWSLVQAQRQSLLKLQHRAPIFFAVSLILFYQHITCFSYIRDSLGVNSFYGLLSRKRMGMKPSVYGYTVAAPLAVIPAGIPAGITAVKFQGGHIGCHPFELAAECAAAS